MKRGFIYLLKNSGGKYKIGITKNPVYKRVNELNSSTSSDGLIEAVAYAEVSNINKLERTLHRKYEEARFKNPSKRFNEWFDLNEIEVHELYDIFKEKCIGESLIPKPTAYYKLVQVEKELLGTTALETDSILKAELKKEQRAELEAGLRDKIIAAIKNKIGAVLLREITLTN